MKKLIVIVSLIVMCLSLQAQTNNAIERGFNNVKSWVKPESGDLFSKGETSLTLAGTYTKNIKGGADHLFDSDFQHGKFGLNIGVTYFTSKYIGIGFDSTCTDLDNPGKLLVDDITLNTVVRYPINRAAPYIVAGLGRSFDNGQYYFEGGAGLEVRINKGFGLFGDARIRRQASTKNDPFQIRAGLNFSF